MVVTKKIAVTGHLNIEHKVLNELLPLFKRENIELVFIPNDLNGRVADVSILEKDSSITGLIIDGGARDTYNIFEAISKLKKNSLSDIYVHYTNQLKMICKMYPNLKVTGTVDSDNEIIGLTATQMLMDYLLKGAPLISKEVGSLKLAELIYNN